MKQLLLLAGLVFCLQLSGFAISTPVQKEQTAITVQKETPSPASKILARIASLSLKEAARLKGKKLTLKEKLGLKILKHQYKKNNPSEEEDAAKKGKTAFILGIIALPLIFVPYGMIASIVLGILAVTMGNSAKKVNPDDSKAKTAVILGWISLGLVAAFLLIAIAFIASFAALL